MKNRQYLKSCFIIFMLLILFIGCKKDINAEEKKDVLISSERNRQKVNADKIDQSNMDVIFVMDKSGSMVRSDKDRLAISGAKMFLDMMRDSGSSHVAVVDFASKATFSSMIKIENTTDKDYIKEYLNRIKYNSGVTDYGLALKKAVSLLDEVDGNNQKAILFFTDGNLNTGKKREISEARDDIKQAISEAEEKGYKIYCIGLDDNKKVDKVELSKIASVTKGNYYIINEAPELMSVFESIFTDIGDVTAESIGTKQGEGIVSFTIDNENVVEANIIMLSDSKLSNVKLYNPKGNKVNLSDEKSYILTKEKRFSVLKIISPEAGKWKLYVKGAKKDNIKIKLVYNYNLSMEASASVDKMQRGGVIEIFSHLVNRGNIVKGKSFYKKLAATANIKFFQNGEEIASEDLKMNAGENGFSVKKVMEKVGEYKLTVHIEDNKWYRDSKTMTVSAKKLPIERIKELSVISVRKGETKKLKLTDYFKDPEGEDLTFTVAVAGKDHDKLKEALDGSLLKVYAENVGSEVIVLTVSNGYGEDVFAKIEIKGETFLSKYGIEMAIVIVIIIVIVFFLFYSFLRKHMKGSIELQVVYGKKDNNNNSEVETEDYKIYEEIPLDYLGEHGFTADRLIKLFGEFYKKESTVNDNSDYDTIEKRVLKKLRRVSFQPGSERHSLIIKRKSGNDIVFLGKNYEVINEKAFKINIKENEKMEFGIKVSLPEDEFIKLNAVYRY